MTSDVDPVRSRPQYAGELTTDVVWEIGDFLLPRLERAARAHPSLPMRFVLRRAFFRSGRRVVHPSRKGRTLCGPAAAPPRSAAGARGVWRRLLHKGVAARPTAHMHGRGGRDLKETPVLGWAMAELPMSLPTRSVSGFLSRCCGRRGLRGESNARALWLTFRHLQDTGELLRVVAFPL